MSKISSSLVQTGQFCTVTFITNSGEIRTINGRTGVKKYQNGVAKYKTAEQVAQTERDYLLIYTRCGSVRFDAPRNINRLNIISVKAHGIKAQKNAASDYATNV